jgi:hypothetical protein
MILIRPDGYIGVVTTLDAEGVKAVNSYFEGFMTLRG